MLLLGLVVIVHDYLIGHCIVPSLDVTLQIDTQNAFPGTILLPQDSPVKFTIVAAYLYTLPYKSFQLDFTLAILHGNDLYAFKSPE